MIGQMMMIDYELTFLTETSYQLYDTEKWWQHFTHSSHPVHTHI
jgi:hypothetical protein